MTLEEAVKEMGGLMQPTPDERKNGWTPEELTLYHAQRAKSSFDRIMNPPKPRPDRTTSAMKWL